MNIRLIIDTNKIMATLIRNSIIRRILFHPKISYYMPEYALNEIDIKKVISKIEDKYKVKLPKTIKKIYVDEDGETLYIEFKHSKYKEGEPTKDGKIILFYDKEYDITAIEILYPDEYIRS